MAALEARTEGWAAGLQLAALSAREPRRRSGGVAGFVEAFTGSHRFVLDYLVEEVLDRPAGRRTRVPARHLRARPADRRPLRRADRPRRRSADAGDPGAREPVRRPARRRAPVVPLPPPVRRRAARPAGRPAPRPGRRPARRGQPVVRRARHAGRCRPARDRRGDHEHAADLVELAVADLRRRRQDRTLRDWLVALPDDVVRRRPLLATFMAWSRLSEGDLDGVEAWLDAAEAGSGPTPRRRPPRAPARWPRRPGTARPRSAPSRP